MAGRGNLRTEKVRCRREEVMGSLEGDDETGRSCGRA